jgi:hypothetical protein
VIRHGKLLRPGVPSEEVAARVRPMAPHDHRPAIRYLAELISETSRSSDVIRWARHIAYLVKENR